VTPLSPSSRLLLKSQLQGVSSYAASPINKEKVLKMAAAAAAGSSSAAAQSNSSSSSHSSASGSRSARAYNSSQMQQLLQLQQQALQQQQQQVQHMDVDRREQLPVAPVTPQIQQQQQQQQQGLVNAASYGSSNPGTSSSLASKAVPVSDSPVATPRNPGSLVSPRADLATSSPFKLAAATNLKTPRDPIAALKGATGRLYGPNAESQLKSDETLRPLIMQSAKSSPLMVFDVKQLQLESGYGVQLRAEDETAVRQRKKWLLGSLKIFNQCTSPDTTEDDEL
jgi:hypothetical protein